MTEARQHHRARHATEEAASWYLDQREGLSAAQQVQFLAWLRHSPLHVGEYLAIAQLHGDLKAVAAMDTMSREQLHALTATESAVIQLYPNDSQTMPRAKQSHAARPKKRRVMVWLTAASVAAVVLAGASAFLVSTGESRLPADVYTSTDNEPRSLSLPDGTLIHLDRNSSIAVRFDVRQRHIDVRRGGAIFDVGKDPARPLQVTLGANVLRDIGTVFEARRLDAGGVVTVISGRVDVLAAGHPLISPWIDAWDRQLGQAPTPSHVMAALQAGQQAHVNANGAVTALVPHADIAQATAWLPADIGFQHSTVAEVARRFNTYTTRPLEIDDAAVASMRISGRFHAHDVDAFVAYLQTLPGVTVQRDDEKVRVLATAPLPPHRRQRL